MWGMLECDCNTKTQKMAARPHTKEEQIRPTIWITGRWSVSEFLWFSSSKVFELNAEYLDDTPLFWMDAVLCAEANEDYDYFFKCMFESVHLYIYT